MNTLQQLAEIPHLATEAFMTWNHPNPGGRAATTKRPRPGTKAPTDLAVLDALRPDPDAQGRSLRGLLMQTVWAIYEEDPDRYPRLPEQTFTGLCEWLTAAHDHWLDNRTHGPRLAKCATCREYGGVEGFVHHTVTDVHRELSSLCRITREPRYICPVCAWPMRLQDGDYFMCDTGQHQSPGPVALEQQWRRKPPRPATDIIDMFSTEMGATLTEEQLRQWKSRGKIPDAGKDGRRSLYLPWDVMRCLMPDVVEALDVRL